MALLGSLGRQQDDAEGSAGAVDGRRRGVLQHGDRLDVVGVDRRHVGLHAVDQHEGRTAGTDRVLGAADADRGRTVGLAVGEGHRQSRNGALERTGDAHRRTGALLKRLGREGLDGTDDVAAFLDAVADDHDLLEAGVVLLERDVDTGLVADGPGLGFVTDVAECQGFVLRSLDRVETVGVGRRTASGAGNDDGGAEDGISLVVFDGARYAPVPLGQNGQGEESQDECQSEVSDAGAGVPRGVIRAGRVALFH